MPSLPARPSALLRALTWALLALFASNATAQDRYQLQPNESVVVVGNSFAERLAMSGYLEALIHAAHPDHQITVRQVPWSADEAGFQPRELNVPTTEAYLTEHEADVIIACFGMTESFAGEAGLAQFETDLRAQLARWADNRYNGSTPPGVVLITPIQHEDLGAPWPTGQAVRDHNADIARYAQAMRRVAGDTDAALIDLTELDTGPTDQPLTTDGILPSEHGCWLYTRAIADQLSWLDETPGNPDAADALRRLAWDKHYHFRQIYRPTNTEYVWGRRAEPFGVVNFPPEQEQLRRMVDARQRELWQMEKPSPATLLADPPSGKPVWEIVPASDTYPEDSWSPPPVLAKGTETSLGNTEILPPSEFLDSFTLADGYTIECFASEQQFPQLANPLAMAFDERHRLWVLCSPTYPHPLPGEMVKDQLIILTDEDNDGKADRCDVFAEDFGIATGFALDTDGVYIALAPDLLFFQDTDGDGKADRREVVLTGFGMPDSHHQISALEWSPDGGFVLHEGTFTRTGVETPWGPRRGRDAAIWHFEPTTRRLELLSHCGFPNPWGHAFDDYGASLMDATSGGSHYYMSHISTASTFPRKPGKPGPVVNRGRPTAGNEIVASRHFPEAAHNSHLTTQSIGFHGLRWDSLQPAGSSWRATPMPQDLLRSSDTNFRPVGVEIGPDGTLYVLDWSNPIIGHMQYSVRDPRRDNAHGRVWRVKHESRPTLTPPDIVGATTAELLEILHLPERNTRAHARRRLQRGDPADVLPALTAWRNAIDSQDPARSRLLLEALWISHAQGQTDQPLLEQVLTADAPEARAAAVRLARRWMRTGAMPKPAAARALAAAAEDPDMRVRLEAVVAAGYLETPASLDIIEQALASDTDGPMRIVVAETIEHLKPITGLRPGPIARAHLARLGRDAFEAADWDDDKAFVALRRHDIPADTRTRALSETAGEDPAARLDTLLTALFEANDTPRLAEASAQLVLDTARALDPVPEPDPRLADHPAQPVRALAAAWALERGTPLAELLDADKDAAIRALTMRGSQPVDEADQSALLTAAEAREVEPQLVIDLLTASNPDSTTLTDWLTARLRAAADLTLDDWTPQHALALTAYGSLLDLPADRWPEDLRELRFETDTESLARGQQLYADELNGCVRCHGQDGKGLEGFPPLANSPWVLGDPRRAAAIVVHGLQGQIDVTGSESIDSVMAPLGAVLNDNQIADVLTFVRTSWGNQAPPVTAAQVAQARDAIQPPGSIPTATAINTTYPLESDPLLPFPRAESPEPPPATSANTNPAPRSSTGRPLGMAIATYGLVAIAILGAITIFILSKRVD